MKSAERTTEFISTETVVPVAEYLILLCRALDAVEQYENNEMTEMSSKHNIA